MSKRAPAVIILLCVGWAVELHGQMLNLGAAAGYAGLELSAAPVTFTLSKVTARVDGNIGVAPNGSFDFSGGGIVTGGIYAGTGANVTISGGSTATDGVFTNYAGINQAVADARAAAAFYSGLTPSQTLSSLGAGTITGNGGLNVFQINGDLALSRSTLTLSGGANDVFVFNITGQVNLSRSNIVLSGVSPSAVLFNLIGTGQKVLSTGDSNTEGVFLAENGAIQIDGGMHTSDFIAGDTLIWQSGVNITQATSAAIVAVPEAGTVATLVLTTCVLGALGFGRRHQRRIGDRPPAHPVAAG